MPAPMTRPALVLAVMQVKSYGRARMFPQAYVGMRFFRWERLLACGLPSVAGEGGICPHGRPVVVGVR